MPWNCKLGPRQSKPIQEIITALEMEGRTFVEVNGVNGDPESERRHCYYSPFSPTFRADVAAAIAALKSEFEPIGVDNRTAFSVAALTAIHTLQGSRPEIDKRKDPPPPPPPPPLPQPEPELPDNQEPVFVRDKYAGQRKHKLLPLEISRRLPKLNSQEKVVNPVVQVKFFSPYGNWTWYAVEGQDDGEDFRFYGYVVGHEKEWGYFCLSELEMAYGSPNMRINGQRLRGVEVPLVERDCYFTPRPISKFEPDAVNGRGVAPEAAAAPEPNTVRVEETALDSTGKPFTVAVHRTVEPTGNVTVSRNTAKDGVELRFAVKPEPEVLARLKGMGWRWAFRSQCWYIRYSEAALSFAQQIAGQAVDADANGNGRPKDALTLRSFALAAFPAYKGRKFRLKVSEGGMSLTSYWSGGSREYHVVIRLEDMKQVPVPENGSGFTAVDKKFGAAGLPVSLPAPGYAVVTHSIFCGKDSGLVVTIHPENAARVLEA